MLTAVPIEMWWTATLAISRSCQLAHTVILTVVKALTVLALVTNEINWAATVGLVALVDCATAVVKAVVCTQLFVTLRASEAGGTAASWHPRQGSSTGTTILAVSRALVLLALVPSVAWLASALGLLAGIEETAATIEANQVTGVRGWNNR